jgi:hypothetical protein
MRFHDITLTPALRLLAIGLLNWSQPHGSPGRSVSPHKYSVMLETCKRAGQLLQQKKGNMAQWLPSRRVSFLAYVWVGPLTRGFADAGMS